MPPHWASSESSFLDPPYALHECGTAETGFIILDDDGGPLGGPLSSNIHVYFPTANRLAPVENWARKEVVRDVAEWAKKDITQKRDFL